MHVLQNSVKHGADLVPFYFLLIFENHHENRSRWKYAQKILQILIGESLLWTQEFHRYAIGRLEQELSCSYSSAIGIRELCLKLNYDTP